MEHFEHKTKFWDACHKTKWLFEQKKIFLKKKVAIASLHLTLLTLFKVVTQNQKDKKEGLKNDQSS